MRLFVERTISFVCHSLPVDLMSADEHTFSAIQQKGHRCEIEKGLRLAIPSPLHLIAMKLHAMRNPQRFERGVDLQDVKHLIKAANVDPSSAEFIEIARRYGNEKIQARVLRELREDSRS